MDNNYVVKLLKNYRCYEYAANNCGPEEGHLPLMISERKRNPYAWDRSRYNRIVRIIKGAVDHVLSDDQRIVINRKYLDRNTSTINEIADVIHKDRSTVSRWHTEAVRRLAIAMDPISKDEQEITNFDHMFEKESAS